MREEWIRGSIPLAALLGDHRGETGLRGMAMERSRGRVWSAWYTSTWKTCRWCGHHVVCLADPAGAVVATLCISCDLGRGATRREHPALRSAWRSLLGAFTHPR
jgi:hypothetical protein